MCSARASKWICKSNSSTPPSSTETTNIKWTTVDLARLCLSTAYTLAALYASSAAAKDNTQPTTVINYYRMALHKYVYYYYYYYYWLLRPLYKEAEYCYQRVCMSARLRIPKTTYPSSPNFQYMLPVAVACSSSDDNTLPVSWITSHLHTMARNRRHEKGVYSNWLSRGSIGSERSLVYNTTALFRCWRKSLQSFFYSVLTLKNAIGFTGFPLSYNSTYNAYLSKPAADGPWRSQRYCW